MEHRITPSSIMYTHLKARGITYHDAAMTLLRTQLSFAGRPLKSRIEERSQLSRRIVHVEPGEIPATFFVDFRKSCTALTTLLVAHAGTRQSQNLAIATLIDYFRGSASLDMAAALTAFGADATLYQNTIDYIGKLKLDAEVERLKLFVMLFTITGCLGDSAPAVDSVVGYANEVLHADFATPAPLHTSTPHCEPDDTTLALMRVVDGKIGMNAVLLALDPNGTEIGLLSTAEHAIRDVGEDVSRRHARIWRDAGAWFIADLGSTNGTVVEKAGTEERIELRAARDESEEGLQAAAVAIEPTDIIHLAASTSFIVMLAADE